MVYLKKDREILNNETNIKIQRNFNDLKEPWRNLTTYNFFLISNIHIFKKTPNLFLGFISKKISLFPSCSCGWYNKLYRSQRKIDISFFFNLKQSTLDSVDICTDEQTYSTRNTCNVAWHFKRARIA